MTQDAKLKDWLGDPLNPHGLPVVRLENSRRGSICVPVDDLIELMAWAAKGHASLYEHAVAKHREADYLLSIWAALTGSLDHGEWRELYARISEIELVMFG